MEVTHDGLARELKTLRKGRGIQAANVGDRVGPMLRAVCEVADDATAGELREHVAARLGELITQLPEDLRIALLAAFGLGEEVRLPFYKDRVEWIATRIDRDVRTAQRRIDHGIGRLTELALADAGPGAGPAAGDVLESSWHTTELRVTLAVDQPVPEAFEFRRIVADRDGVTELDLALTLTAPAGAPGTARADELDAHVFQGGRLVKRMMESNDRVGMVLQLPDRLNRGDSHEIALRFRAKMQPHYVCVPRYPCDLFDLWVHFGTDHQPHRVWRLAHAFQDDVRDPGVNREQVPLNSLGEVHVRFQRLAPGFAYGVTWEYS